ncbi:DUF5916 domain-containing protein [Robertkochia sediminum]|uniref:DUF5916 domain-containing protein n=1 Tax=Robertkochia sediminum TaxID=2785326 RepID=UPI00193259A4|nr:DUF5916 domain-containing protein [Robertkochia sediminum]MBL7472244.1 carbohydrate binding family 9 domain-containing protein [Robertkochia sediminum]
MKFVFASIALLCSFLLLAQEEHKSFTVKYTQQSFSIDGILDEEAWETADSAHDFMQYFPTDSVLAHQPTDIKMLVDDATLYLGITVYTSGKDYVIPSLQRDFRAGGNDNISLMFDTFNDGTNAFLFGINPLGVRREALISNGGGDLGGFTTSWDIKWQGETRIYEDHYTAEIAIPLTSLKFRDGETKFRFNSYRFDMQDNEQSTWYPIPQNQLIFNLAFMGDMVFEKPLGRSRTPIALIPYINAQANKDYVTDKSMRDMKVGGDAKIAVGGGMNLDLTLNPDFSNVEVDNIVVNLSRFEISLPERRQFFIDNSDLFGTFGDERDMNPFFSRRIGIATNKDGETIENPIIAGARLSGKINEDWRLGLMNIQTEEDVENEIASRNNTVIALQKKMFSRSNLSFLFVNRETFDSYDFLDPEERYNRVVGLDYNLASEDNTWVGKFFLHKAFATNIGDESYTGGINLRHNSTNFSYGIRGNYVGDDFRSDLGFIRRTDIVSARPFAEYTIWKRGEKINNYSFRVNPNFIWRPTLDYQNTDYAIFSTFNVAFTNQAEFTARLINRYTFLTDPFDPTGTEGAEELPGDVGYYYNSFQLQYRSDRRKILSFEVRPDYGTFYNGTRLSLRGGLNLRLQPKMLFSVDVNYDRIDLPGNYPDADIWLIVPRMNITFSKSVFWSTLFQYSNQLDNLGINSRLQWRFAPLSDLFLVYNDNYFVNAFEPKNRSINLKVSYWLNI